MEEVYKICDSAELIHPARFLFNAGSTPKSWNQKTLQDPHFKVLHYEADSSKIFPNTDIKGGIVVSYRDISKDFGIIDTFTPFDELNSILRKVKGNSKFESLSSIIITSYAYHFLEQIYIDQPNLRGSLSRGHEFDLKSNVFEKMPKIFYDKNPGDGYKYIRILGRINNERQYKFVREDYINNVSNLHTYAFDLNLFFETKNGKFTHESSVNKFLDALTTQEKFPFSTEELRNELKHTLWFLNRVDSAKALAKKLKEHPVFQEYYIVVAAGDGKLEEDDEDAENKKSFDKVTEAIRKYDKTITLSVGQLTTGITIPEWTAVLMLSNMKSPPLYMQTAFRAQNPCLFKENGQFYRKENAYVFDFDPARTLTIFEQFANDLCEETASGKGDSDKRKENVREDFH